MNQVRHVFVGPWPDATSGADVSLVVRAGRTVQQRKAIFFIDLAADDTVKCLPRDGSVLYDAVKDLRMAMFADPYLVGDTNLIFSPSLNYPEKPFNGGDYQTAQIGIATRPEIHNGGLCTCDITNFALLRRLVRGEMLVFRIRFNDIYDLSPGQKYIDIHYQVKTTSPDSGTVATNVTYAEELVNGIVSIINANKYLAQFITASRITDTPAVGPVHLRIVAKTMPYDNYQRYPNRMIKFTANLLKANGASLYFPTQPNTRAIIAYPSRGTQDRSSGAYVQDQEKDSQGYRGLTNVTAFPVTPMTLRAEKDKTYMGLVINIRRPYRDPANVAFDSNETVEMYFEAPLDLTADAHINDTLETCVNRYIGTGAVHDNP